MPVTKRTRGKWGCGDITLEKGDILLERASFGFNSILISIGQKIGGSSKATTVHAGIYVGDGKVSQSHGVGLTTDSLDGHNKWKVYRHRTRWQDIGDCAADFGQNMVIRSRNVSDFGSYSRTRATRSLTPGRDKVIAANDVSNFLNNVDKADVLQARTFFCSNFVVLCYSLASEIITSHPHYCINIDFERASPGEMAEYLDSNVNWARVGEITG
jgi:hypothetical protein